MRARNFSIKRLFGALAVFALIGGLLPLASVWACPNCCKRICEITHYGPVCEEVDSECEKMWQEYIAENALDDFEKLERPDISLQWLVRFYEPRKIKHSDDYWYELTTQSYILPDIIQVEGIVAALSLESGTLLVHSPGLKRGINIFSPERLLGCNDFAGQELQGLKTGDYVTLRGQLHKNSSKRDFISLQHCIVVSGPGKQVQ